MSKPIRANLPSLSRRNFLANSAVFAGVVGLSGTLAACGGGGSSDAGTSKTIRFLTDEDNADTIEVTNKVFKAFESKHPGVKIVTEVLGPSNADQRLAQLIGAGDPPDLVKRGSVQLLALQQAGQLLPMNDAIGGMGVVPSESRLTIGGDDYMVPMDSSLWLTFYRKDLMDAAGLGAPETWEDYPTIYERLGGDVYGDIVVTNAASDYASRIFEAYCFNAGARFWDWQDDAWAVALDDAASRDAMMKTLDFFGVRKDNSPATGNYDYAEVSQAFSSGKVAIADYIGARALLNLRDQAPDLLDKSSVTTLPVPVGKELLVPRDTAGLGLVKGGKADTTLVQELASFFATGQNHVDYLWTVPGHLVPTTKEELEGEWRSDPFLQSRPDLLDALDKSYASSYTNLKGIDPGQDVQPNPAESAIAANFYYAETLSSVLSGDDPKSAIDNLVGQMQTAAAGAEK